jgi:hypothetical protein
MPMLLFSSIKEEKAPHRQNVVDQMGLAQGLRGKVCPFD